MSEEIFELCGVSVLLLYKVLKLLKNNYRLNSHVIATYAGYRNCFSMLHHPIYILSRRKQMKKTIRKQMLEIRNKMEASDVESFSRSIFERLVESRLLPDASHVMVYLDFRNEVRTDPIIRYCLENSKNVYVPICVPETHELVISRVTSFDDLESGFYGIREPKKSSLRLSDSSVLDLVLIPGTAFDLSGNRIGFGAGYYDRFLKRLSPAAKKVALAYSFQVIDSVPADQYDVPVDYIATEKEIIRCKPNS